MELEEKDKQIKQLTRELEVLKLKIKEDKDTIYNLCNQINRLTKYQKQNAEQS